MEMVAHSVNFALPKTTTENNENSAPKKSKDEDCCLSFPSMLEQKQAPEAKKGTATTSAVVHSQDSKASEGDCIEDGFAKLGNAGVPTAKTDLPGTDAQGPMTSIASFLKTLTLVSTDQPNQEEPLKCIPANTKTSPADVAVIVDDIVESTANILGKTVGESTPKFMPAEATPLSTLQAVTPIENTMQGSQEITSEDPQTPTSNTVNSLPSSDLIPDKAKATPLKPMVEVLTQAADKAAPAKTQNVERDVVLASNKTPESTYTAPEKMVMEKPVQKSVLSEAPTNVESDLSREIKGKTTAADDGKIVQQKTQASMMDSHQQTATPQTNEAEVQPTAEAASVQSDLQAALDNFTVPAGIKMNIGTQATQATPEVDHTSNTANIRRQVIQHLASRLEGPLGGEKITLYLNPEKLGQVEVQITAKNDSLTVVMTTGEGQVEKAIQDSVKDLTESLLARGGRFQQVEVKVESKGTQSDREQSRQNENKDKESQNQQDSHKDHDQQNEPEHFAWASAMQEG